MSKRVLAIGFALVFVTMCIVPASAQTGWIGAYFDPLYTVEDHPNPCPGVGQSGVIFYAAINWNTFITGVQFQVDYPAAITPNLVAEAYFGTVHFGNTATGLAMSWSLPQNGFFPVPCVTTPFTWNCDNCVGFENSKIVVRDHDLLGPVAITDWPAFNLIEGPGLTALICATIATEETTWGNIKALYK